jgi:hypothetical protein
MLFLMIFSTLNNKEKVNAHHKYSDVCQTIDDYLKAKRFRKYLSKKKKKKKKIKKYNKKKKKKKKNYKYK